MRSPAALPRRARRRRDVDQPVVPVAAGRCGGYDVADYRDVGAFGTLDEEQRFIDDAHAHGIRVILDIVPNHTSDQHAWFVATLAASVRAHRAPATSSARDRRGWRSAPERLGSDVRRTGLGAGSRSPTERRGSGTSTCSPSSSRTSTGTTARFATSCPSTSSGSGSRTRRRRLPDRCRPRSTSRIPPCRISTFPRTTHQSSPTVSTTRSGTGRGSTTCTRVARGGRHLRPASHLRRRGLGGDSRASRCVSSVGRAAHRVTTRHRPPRRGGRTPSHGPRRHQWPRRRSSAAGYVGAQQPRHPPPRQPVSAPPTEAW